MTYITTRQSAVASKSEFEKLDRNFYRNITITNEKNGFGNIEFDYDDSSVPDRHITKYENAQHYQRVRMAR